MGKSALPMELQTRLELIIQRGLDHNHGAAAILRDMLEALAATYMVVPLEPSHEMLVAAWEMRGGTEETMMLDEDSYIGAVEDLVEDWRAMLAAQAPREPGG